MKGPEPNSAKKLSDEFESSTGIPSVAEIALIEFRETIDCDSLHPAVQAVYEEYLNAIFEVLRGNFQKPATFQNVIASFLQVTQFSLSSGFMLRIKETELEHTPELNSVEIRKELKQELGRMPDYIEKLETINREALERVQEYESLMLSSEVGLNSIARDLYSRNSLSIGDLFVIQPGLFITGPDL